jgi:predicted transcriptional regulator
LDEINFKLDKLDLKIIYTLLLEENLSPLKAVKVNELMEQINMNVSYVTFNRRIVTKLIPSGYIKEGYKEGHSKTYYLTNSGKQYFEENVLSEEQDAFEIIEIGENEEDN